MGQISGSQDQLCLEMFWAFLVAQTVKNLLAVQETQIQSLDQEDPLERGMATHSRILPGELHGRRNWWAIQSMGSQRVGHD